MDFEKALELAQLAAKESRAVLLNYFGKIQNIEKKHMAGLVTEADKQSELKIVEILQPFGVSITGEEGSFKASKDEIFKAGQTRWLIDPLDGTTNYVHGFPIFCISIALQVEGDVKVAVIDVPILNKTYTSIKGQGAFCNGSKLSVSSSEDLADCLASTGFFAENPVALKRQLQFFSQMVSTCRGIRRAGAAAFDLCLVAEGVFDVFWEEGLQPWDTAAGLLLVNEAGGRLTTYNGSSYFPEAKNILATNSLVHKQCLDQF